MEEAYFFERLVGLPINHITRYRIQYLDTAVKTKILRNLEINHCQNLRSHKLLYFNLTL